MRNLLIPSFFLSSSLLSAAAYAVPKLTGAQASIEAAPVGGGDRRAFLSNLAGAAIASSSVVAVHPRRAIAADDAGGTQDVYFGVGCFWHVQHEFTLAERSLLGRKDNELTSLTGYAGGTKAGAEGQVCYHNFQSMADYGKLGHGEVVGVSIPSSTIGDFAVEYFKLFGDTGERADVADTGGEYRSLLGLPGGRNHPMFGRVEAAAGDRGMKLVDGKGNDPDTLGKRLVYVMDSNKFPFYQAEAYHQYHDDFLTPAYGKKYNDLVEGALDDGRIKTTGCPDRLNQLKTGVTAVKQGEGIILAGAGVAIVCLVSFVLCLLCYRPKFLYMPIYETYEKDSDTMDGVDVGTEMVKDQIIAGKDLL